VAAKNGDTTADLRIELTGTSVGGGRRGGFWRSGHGRHERNLGCGTRHDGSGFKVSPFHAATVLMLVTLGPGHFVTSNHIPL
jgi:hypothetical protein